LKVKLKVRHFNTIEAMEAESQAVLNTSQNTTSRMHLKMALGVVHTQGRALLRRAWWPVGPKLVFDQMAAPSKQIHTRIAPGGEEREDHIQETFFCKLLQ
jgi:hypothetical protein